MIILDNNRLQFRFPEVMRQLAAKYTSSAPCAFLTTAGTIPCHRA